MQQQKFIDIPISSTCFGRFFAHHQERKTLFYSMWYNSPKLLPATGRQQVGCIIPHAVKRSLALLRMGKKSSETCWADWNNNKFLLLHLVGLLQSVPLATEPGISLIILILSGSKWWPLPALVVMSSHFLHNEVSPLQISFQYPH